MSDDTLNGNGNGVKVDARFLALLARFYTIEALESWLARAREGMHVKRGQVERWQRALAWLRSEQEQVDDDSD